MYQLYDEQTPALIVGGGLVGLSAAAFLGWHGIRPLLVERAAEPSRVPRCRSVDPRTMELFAQIGLAERIERAASPLAGRDTVVYADTLAGPELAPPHDRLDQRADDLSERPWVAVEQHALETLLRERAVDLGADVRLGVELVSLDCGPDGVTAVIEDGERPPRIVRADYLIAADGAASPIRGLLGIGQSGPGVLHQMVTVGFTAPLDAALRGRRPARVCLANPAVRGVLAPVDGSGEWTLDVRLGPAADMATPTDAGCVELVRAAVGQPDLPVELVGAPRRWQVSAACAERFEHGRVFLAGDAAHVLPPTGAVAASAGVHDAHNLAWKLGAVLLGQAGDELLATYDAERRPVVEFAMAQATRIYRQLTGVGPAAPPPEVVAARPASGTRPVEVSAPSDDGLDPMALYLGYRYRSAAVLDHAEQAGADHAAAVAEDPRRPTGRPGVRAPHVPLTRDGERIGPHALFGRGYVLLAGPDGGDWLTAARGLASRFGVDVSMCLITHDTAPAEAGQLTDTTGRFYDAYGVGPAGAVLVRPDGFVGWRSPTLAPRPAETLTATLARLLCREAPASTRPRARRRPWTRTAPRLRWPARAA